MAMISSKWEEKMAFLVTNSKEMEKVLETCNERMRRQAIAPLCCLCPWHCLIAIRFPAFSQSWAARYSFPLFPFINKSSHSSLALSHLSTATVLSPLQSHIPSRKCPHITETCYVQLLQTNQFVIISCLMDELKVTCSRIIISHSLSTEYFTQLSYYLPLVPEHPRNIGNNRRKCNYIYDQQEAINMSRCV